MHDPQIDSTDQAAAASAVCAAKSAGWAALRRLHAGTETRSAAYSQMIEADAMAEEFRATYYPRASRAIAAGDRGIGQPFEMYVVADDVRRVWAEVAA